MNLFGGAWDRLVARVEEINKLYHTSAPQLENFDKNLQLLRTEVVSLRTQSASHDGRIGTLEAQVKIGETQAKERHDALLKSVEDQRNTIDAKIQAAKSDMNAELQKAKAEMSAEFHKAKSEAVTDLNRAFTKFAFDFSRESGEQNITAVASQRPAIEAASSDGREPN